LLTLARDWRGSCRVKDLSVVSALLLGANGGSTALWPWSLSKALAHMAVVPLREVASFAFCKPGGMGWIFWQMEIRKVMQCCWQLLGLVTAQTFLKGLSKSWRTL